VRILRYVVVHDCGRMLNPVLVEGQVHGGVVHGIGAALLEHLHYDEQGQPLSVTYADYLLPTADGLPMIEIEHMESPTPLNPLGVKGAAESGTIGAPSALIAAVEDALQPLGLAQALQISEFPLSPARLLSLIDAARQG
jgi:carbon-monoxide dehydrogenase large subunit